MSAVDSMRNGLNMTKIGMAEDLDCERALKIMKFFQTGLGD